MFTKDFNSRGAYPVRRHWHASRPTTQRTPKSFPPTMDFILIFSSTHLFTIVYTHSLHPTIAKESSWKRRVLRRVVLSCMGLSIQCRLRAIQAITIRTKDIAGRMTAKCVGCRAIAVPSWTRCSCIGMGCTKTSACQLLVLAHPSAIRG